jgi:hypothetical protein
VGPVFCLLLVEVPYRVGSKVQQGIFRRTRGADDDLYIMEKRPMLSRTLRQEGTVMSKTASQAQWLQNFTSWLAELHATVVLLVAEWPALLFLGCAYRLT